MNESQWLTSAHKWYLDQTAEIFNWRFRGRHNVFENWFQFQGELAMDSKSPNVEALRQLYKQSPVAKAFLDLVAGRERDQSETKVDRILLLLNRTGGNEFQRREIIELFRRLQDQGCGQFVEGRRGGHPDLSGALD